MAASTEILIGESGGQHVVIRPLSRSHPGLFDYWDGNWIVCEVEIAAGGFRGGFRADLRGEEFLGFLNETAELSRTLEGAASLTSMEGQIALTLTGDGRGLVRVAGEAVDVAGSGNRLQFGFGIDQTCLPEIARLWNTCSPPFPCSARPMSPSGPSTLKKDHLAGGASRLPALILLKYVEYSRSSRFGGRAPRSGPPSA